MRRRLLSFAILCFGSVSLVQGGTMVTYQVDPWIIGGSVSASAGAPWTAVTRFDGTEVGDAKLSFELPVHDTLPGDPGVAHYSTANISLGMTVVDTRVYLDALLSATINAVTQTIVVDIFGDGVRASIHLEGGSLSGWGPDITDTSPHWLTRLNEFGGYFTIFGSDMAIYSDYNAPMYGPPSITYEVPESGGTLLVLLIAAPGIAFCEIRRRRSPSRSRSA